MRAVAAMYLFSVALLLGGMVQGHGTVGGRAWVLVWVIQVACPIVLAVHELA